MLIGVTIGLAFPLSLIALENSKHSFHQSYARVNPAMIFSRTRALYVSTFSSLQAPGVLTRYFVLVGHCKYAGFGFYDFSG